MSIQNGGQPKVKKHNLNPKSCWSSGLTILPKIGEPPPFKKKNFWNGGLICSLFKGVQTYAQVKDFHVTPYIIMHTSHSRGLFERNCMHN